MKNKEPKKRTEKKHFTFHLREKSVTDLKIYCMKTRQTLSSVLSKMIDDFVEEKKKSI